MFNTVKLFELKQLLSVYMFILQTHSEELKLASFTLLCSDLRWIDEHLSF